MSGDDLVDGVELGVEDPDGVVDLALIFLPPDEEAFIALHPALANGDVPVLRDFGVPRIDGEPFDVVAVYRTGPFCGRLPAVSVSVEDEVLHLDIASIAAGDFCDSLEYDEAIGLRLKDGARDLEVRATHQP